MKTRTLAAALAILLLSGCSGIATEEEAPVYTVSAPVITQRELHTIARGSVDSRLAFNVSFGSARQSSLYMRSSGRLKRLYASVGQEVKEGQLLAELDATALATDVVNAEIDLRRKQITLDAARSKKGFVDEPSATDLEKLELDLAQSQAALQTKRESYNNTRLVAPFSGRILSVAFAEGDQVDAYKEVMVLAASGQVVARANVDDNTAAQLAVGQAVEIFPSDGNPAPVRGKVLSIPPAGTLKVEKITLIAPDEPSPRLQAGRNGRVEVVLQRKENVLLVPLSAIRSFGGRNFVTVVRGEGRQEVSIQIGISSSTFAEVLEGLKEGDQVVSR